MEAEASLKRLRANYDRTPPRDKPPSVSEHKWKIFTAYVYDQRPISEIATESDLSISRVRQSLLATAQECLVELPPDGAVTLESPIEHLGLSVRARNSLRKAGCTYVKDVLDLNFASSVRRMGPATRSEILAALRHSGFRHTSIDMPPSEMVNVAQGLERIQTRIDLALRAVSKEVGIIQDRLRRKTNHLP